MALDWSTVNAPGPEAVKYYVRRDGATPGHLHGTGCADRGHQLRGQRRLIGIHSYTVTAVWRSWSATSSASTADITVGQATHFMLAAATLTPTAAVADNLTITAKDHAGTTVTTYAGEHELTFEGAEAIGTNKPTVSNNATGAAIAFGTATGIKFTSGVASVTSSKNGVMKLYKAGPATISVSDGTIESESDPTVTVAPLTMSKLVLTAATTSPTAGEEDALTTTAQDTYGNVATGYTGSKSLKYSGPVASPGGQVPTVTDSSGNEVAIGTTTPTLFTKGVATVSEGKQRCADPLQGSSRECQGHRRLGLERDAPSTTGGRPRLGRLG